MNIDNNKTKDQLTVDGVTLETGDRVLYIEGESVPFEIGNIKKIKKMFKNAKNNGVYEVVSRESSGITPKWLIHLGKDAGLI